VCYLCGRPRGGSEESAIRTLLGYIPWRISLSTVPYLSWICQLILIPVAVCTPPFFVCAAGLRLGNIVQAGRLCAPFVEGAQCCLPCPLTDWVYPDSRLQSTRSRENMLIQYIDFNRLTGVANWLNVGSLSCCAVLLLTLLVLPIQKTSRHYLTICLILAVGFMNVSGLAPSGSQVLMGTARIHNTTRLQASSMP
jgi:hypothetical protein